MKLTRRNLLKTLTAAAATSAVAGPALLRQARAAGGAPGKFLIVVGGFGGASIIDSFMPISESDLTAEEAAVVNAYPASEVVSIANSPFRALDRTDNLFGETYTGNGVGFVNQHRNHMQVVTQTVTSVNHAVGQKRSITGNGAWNGRTLQEAVAMQYGAGCPIPNVNMGSLGFRVHGDDDTVTSEARAEPVADPARWPLALDGVDGVYGHPDRDIVEMARQVRNDDLDPQSRFWQTFQLSERLKRWKQQREQDQPTIEEAELLQKLSFAIDHADLPAFDPQDRIALEGAFGHLAFDPLQIQAAMAYLLIKHGVSVTATISPNFSIVTNPDGELPGELNILNTPLSFDYSHTDHRASQLIMWNRTLEVIDSLIRLLGAAEHPAAPGESLFDHTLIYVATEFGRSKRRNPGAMGFGSAHDLNNGCALFSPLLAGNTLLGGVNAVDGMTYGFDPMDGSPQPGQVMGEKWVYAGILQALGVDTSGSGLPAVPAMLPT